MKMEYRNFLKMMGRKHEVATQLYAFMAQWSVDNFKRKVA